MTFHPSRVFALLALLATAAVAAPASKDSRVRWLAENAVPIRSIDAAEGDDFADLMPLVKSIGSARIVQLGEQSHGEGADFKAKVRLVRFLHEVMGFDVLAWESGLYSCERLNTALRAGQDPYDAARMGVYGVWALSDQSKPLFPYMQSTWRTATPLETTGFDCQFSNTQSAATFSQDILQAFRRAEADGFTDQDAKYLDGLLAAVIGKKYRAEPGQFATDLARIRGWQRAARAIAPAALGARDRDLLVRLLGNLEHAFNLSQITDLQKPDAMLNFRDRFMADNLIWLARERYADRKIIVWAASAHIARHYLAAPGEDQADWVNMGSYLDREFGNELYTIGFIAYQGDRGFAMMKGWKVPKPVADSLDALCHETGLPYLYLDLRSADRNAWISQPLLARPLGYSNVTTRWREVFDGLFFIDTMERSTPLPKEKN